MMRRPGDYSQFTLRFLLVAPDWDWSFAKRRTKTQMLCDIKRFRSTCPDDVQLGQLAIDLTLVAPAAGPTDEGTAQVLAAMHVQVAKKRSPALEIADLRSLVAV